MMVDRLLNSKWIAPQMASNRVQIRAIRCTKWTAGSHAASFCVSGGSTVLLQWPLN